MKTGKRRWTLRRAVVASSILAATTAGVVVPAATASANTWALYQTGFFTYSACANVGDQQVDGFNVLDYSCVADGSKWDLWLYYS